MNLIPRLLTAIVFGIGLLSTPSLSAEDHGHVFFRDHDGNCVEDDDDDDDDCDDEIAENDSHAHDWAHEHLHSFDEEDEEDPTHELDRDTSYPSERALFSEQFH